jgi:hypothetical protein
VSLTAYALNTLDFRPRVISLLPDLALRWSAQLRFVLGRTKLLSWGDALVLVDEGQDLVEIGSERPGDETLRPWKRHGLALEYVGPAYQSDPILLDQDGNVYRWTPTKQPRLVWTPDAPPKSLVVTGLPQDRLLLQHYELQRSQTVLVDTAGRRVLWEIAGTMPTPLPHHDVLMMPLLAEPQTVICVEQDSGHERWRLDEVAGDFGDLVGVVGGALWLTTRAGQIQAIDVATGRLRKTMPVRDHHRPQGVLDAQGRFHVCNGLSYQVLDLDAGRLLEYSAFAVDEQMPGLVLGRTTLPTQDGRLLFADDKGRIYVSKPQQRARPELLWEETAPIFAMGVAHGRLLTIAESCTLRCF